MRAIAAREQKQRKKTLSKYIPDVANAIYSVLERMAGAAAGGGAGDGEAGPAAKRRRTEDPGGGGLLVRDEFGLLPAVAAKEVTAATLASRLSEYVERIDTDMVRAAVEAGCGCGRVGMRCRCGCG